MLNTDIANSCIHIITAINSFAHLVDIFQCDFSVFVFVDKCQKLIFGTNEVGLHWTELQQNKRKHFLTIKTQQTPTHTTQL